MYDLYIVYIYVYVGYIQYIIYSVYISTPVSCTAVQQNVPHSFVCEHVVFVILKALLGHWDVAVAINAEIPCIW